MTNSLTRGTVALLALFGVAGCGTSGPASDAAPRPSPAASRVASDGTAGWEPGEYLAYGIITFKEANRGMTPRFNTARRSLAVSREGRERVAARIVVNEDGQAEFRSGGGSCSGEEVLGGYVFTCGSESWLVEATDDGLTGQVEVPVTDEVLRREGCARTNTDSNGREVCREWYWNVDQTQRTARSRVRVERIN